MFLYGCSGSPELYFNHVAQDFYSFALMHLTCIMFLTTDSCKDKNGGVFHRILDPLGKSVLLRPIDKIFDRKVGKITLKNYLKERRNLLATHRNLSIKNLSPENQEITTNTKAIDKFLYLMRELEHAVRQLHDDLLKLRRNENDPQSTIKIQIKNI